MRPKGRRGSCNAVDNPAGDDSAKDGHPRLRKLKGVIMLGSRKGEREETAEESAMPLSTAVEAATDDGGLMGTSSLRELEEK